ncbi:serine/threonine-protein kinase [Nocardioides acrostichi]|uniref:non-specific serine/threonine protein kinase n=1 Tax=Nocardioides acrostichi TaxID=2784339 RepID=A0A930V0H1_9ACTN|nr:serine/threonine-protein kinase [Nocardioides acrostichi]MBF4163436.1 serine/threonine protein kinase [Nocardioides acrostichi]
MIGERYSLDREIGRGGMGTVWLGRDEVLGRSVAVKRLGLAPGADEPDVERADREARLAARLSHPHIVAVYDLVEHEGTRHLVMEYVEGTNLAALVAAGGPLEPTRAASLFEQVADALAAAHEGGIVHRDVKPSNMLVAEGDEMKLSDFGIARADADPALTQTGLVTGSPAYLAPEVAAGQVATAASDVWSWGASLWHALAGHPPYEVKDNVLGTLYRIVNDDPPRLDDVGWLGTLLEATMAKDPQARWTMAQVRDYLRAGPRAPTSPTTRSQALPTTGTDEGTRVIPAATGAVATTAGRRRRSGNSALLAVIAVMLVALLGVIGVILLSGGDDQPTAGQGAASDTTTSSTSSDESGSPSAEVTSQELENFAGTYVRTAQADPAEGFAMLTPAYQRQSGELSGYQSFWGKVASIDSLEVTGTDTDAGTVTYTYSRTMDDGTKKTETVRLTVERGDDGNLLIVGDS